MQDEHCHVRKEEVIMPGLLPFVSFAKTRFTCNAAADEDMAVFWPSEALFGFLWSEVFALVYSILAFFVSQL